MKDKSIIFFFLLIFSFSFIPQLSAQGKSINDLISHLQDSLKMKDIPAYLENFFPEIRVEEEKKIRGFFNRFKIENVALFKAKRGISGENKVKIYLKALFQNSYSAVIETWQLTVQKEREQWQIKEKKMVGESKQLYKIHIPSDRVEKVKLIEIDHVDIKLTFKDAFLFYDNIPKFETALLVIGNGHLRFTPSNAKEKHQLEMLYKKKFLEDSLNYVYLRFSNFFFYNNIRIVRKVDEKKHFISQAERSEAYSLFLKHYSRSFTIENSLNGELLSFLPQGEEAVFEFKGHKIGQFTYIYSPFAEEEVNLYKWKGNKIISLYSPRVGEITREIFFSFGRMFDIKTYQIEIAFEPKDYHISGKAKIEIKPEVRLLDGLKFKFNPSLEILRIFDQERRELFYTQDKLRKILYVYFFEPPPKDKLSFIEVFYRGKIIPPKQTADVIVGPQFNDNVIHIPLRYDSYLFSQSAYWYPSPPNVDFFKSRLKIIVPPGYSCVSNGKLINKRRLTDVETVEEIEKMGSSVYVFKTEYPLKYISFIVGKFTKLQEDSSPLPLRYFKSSNFRFKRKDLLSEAKNILRFYESRFGPYPYEKLSIVRRGWPTSGGHSPASFIILNEPFQIPGKSRYLNLDSPVDFSRWREYFIAHEIAHQWWGQAVTWKTYHDQWLSEGLAQFSSLLYLREKYGDKVLTPILKKLSHWTKKKSEWGSITMGSRLSYFDFEAYQSIIYNKASLVLNMLKDLLGEKSFFKGLRKFFIDYKYGPANTQDFIRSFKEISDFDLTLFFNGWLNSHTLPAVKISHSLQKRGGRYFLIFTIHQQTGLFVFPLWVEWNLNGEKVVKKLLIDERTEKFGFELDRKPKKIRVNTKNAVPGKFY